MTADAAPRTSIEEQAQHRLAATKLVPEQMFVWHVLRPSTLQISRWAHAYGTFGCGRAFGHALVPDPFVAASSRPLSAWAALCLPR